jgi:hypothetical protein
MSNWSNFWSVIKPSARVWRRRGLAGSCCKQRLTSATVWGLVFLEHVLGPRGDGDGAEGRGEEELFNQMSVGIREV